MGVEMVINFFLFFFLRYFNDFVWHFLVLSPDKKMHIGVFKASTYITIDSST